LDLNRIGELNQYLPYVFSKHGVEEHNVTIPWHLVLPDCVIISQSVIPFSRIAGAEKQNVWDSEAKSSINWLADCITISLTSVVILASWLIWRKFKYNAPFGES
jgi:hypothetical protein